MKINNKTYLAIIFGFAVLLYAQTLSFGYTYHDDFILLVDEQEFWENDPKLLSFFVTPAHQSYFVFYYRPLQNLTYALDIKLSGSVYEPWSFHLTNVLIFALIGCALFLFLVRQKIRPLIAFWVSLLFCANPTFLASVAWIPARGDLFLTLFSLLAMISFVDFLEKNYRLKDLIFTSLFFALALLSKETAVGLPLIFLAWFFINSENKIPQKPHWLLAGALAVVGVFWLWLRTIATINVPIDVTFLSVLKNSLNFPTLFSQLVFPFEPMTYARFSVFKIMLGCLILAGFGVLTLKISKINKSIKWIALISLVWVLVFLWPAFSVIPMDNYYLGHRFLLPAVGMFWLLAAFANEIVSDKQYRLFRMGTLIVIGLFSVLTFWYSRVYETPETYFGAALKANPTNTMAWNGRGYYRQMHGDIDGAESDRLQTLRIDPENHSALRALALINVKRGRFAEAITYYDRVIAVDSTDHIAFLNRGILRSKFGDLEGTLEDFDKLLILMPHLENERNYRDHLRSVLDSLNHINPNSDF